MLVHDGHQAMHGTYLTLQEAISVSFMAQTALPTLLGHTINMDHLYKESKVRENGSYDPIPSSDS